MARRRSGIDDPSQFVPAAIATFGSPSLQDATLDYAPASKGVTNGDSHNHDGGDGAQIAYSSISGLPTLGTAAATDSADYAPAAQGVTNGNTHDHAGGDGAQIAYSGLSGLPSLVVMTSGGITTTASSSNSVWSAVTGSAVNVTAGKTYRIRWMLRTYSAANTTGIGLRRVLTTAVGTVLGWHALGMSNATAVVSRASREGTVDELIAAGNATSSTSASGSYQVEVLFSCSTSGTLGLEMRSEVDASAATIDGDGSYWVAEEW